MMARSSYQSQSDSILAISDWYLTRESSLSPTPHSVSFFIFLFAMHSTFSPVSRPSRSGFTLIEIILVLALFALVAVFSFEALANIGIARLYTTSRTNLESELHFFSERLTTMIKESGTLDYEEYWNRSVVGTATATGHYLLRTGYGNYGSG